MKKDLIKNTSAAIKTNKNDPFTKSVEINSDSSIDYNSSDKSPKINDGKDDRMSELKELQYSTKKESKIEKNI